MKKTAKRHSFKNIARLIRESRELTHWSQTDVALKLGLRQGQFISNVERAKCSIPVYFVPTVSEIIDVPIPVIIDAMVQDYKDGLMLQLGLAEMAVAPEPSEAELVG